MPVSVLANALARGVTLPSDPWPYAVIDDALPTALYEELAQSWPSMRYIAGDDPPELANNRAYLKNTVDILPDAPTSLWREFFEFHTSPAFFREVLALLGATVRAEHPLIEQRFKPLDTWRVGRRQPGKAEASDNLAYDTVLDSQFAINSPVTAPTRARGPHVDSGHKMFSALLYFRDPADTTPGGDFEIYRLRTAYPRRLSKKIPARHVELAATVPYAANRMVIWVNSARAVHGVSPRSITAMERRYVSFTAECYGGPDARSRFCHLDEWDSLSHRLRALVKL